MRDDLEMAESDRSLHFESIFRWLQPRLTGYLARDVSPDVAAHLAGDTLYTIWRKKADIGKAVGDPELAGLAFRIAAGLLKNSQRSERRRRGLAGRYAQFGVRLEHDEDPASGVAVAEAGRDLYLGLSPNDRELVTLLLSGMSSEEIAAALDVAPGTARMRLSRLRSRLAGHLDELMEVGSDGE